MSTAVMIMPGVQKPHCRPWFSWKACCIGCSSPFVASPSMVVTVAPSAWTARHGAGLDRLAVDMDDAGAALRRVAADMGAGQAELLPQQLNEKRAVLDLGRNRFPVHLH